MKAEPFYFQKERTDMNRNPVSQRVLSLFLSLALVLSIFGVDAVGAFAAQDSGIKNSPFGAMRNSAPLTLYLDSGNIAITNTGYSVSNGTEVPYVGS